MSTLQQRAKASECTLLVFQPNSPVIYYRKPDCFPEKLTVWSAVRHIVQKGYNLCMILKKNQTYNQIIQMFFQHCAAKASEQAQRALYTQCTFSPIFLTLKKVM